LSVLDSPPIVDGPVPTLLEDWVDEINGLRRIGREFYSKGWSVGTSSNYSVVVQRNPLRLLVTASGKDKGCLACGDFVLVDEHGEPTEAGQPKSSAETLLHIAAAQDANIGAVLHTHSVWATLLSDVFLGEGGMELTGYEMLKGLQGVSTHAHREWIPIFRNTQQIPTLAADVAVCQASDRPIAHAYLIHQHGLYTWGRDLAEARRHIEILEFLFECKARRMAFPH